MSEITQKPEKIATAVYIITGFFSDQEPLKWKLRTIASTLAPLGSGLDGNSFVDEQRAKIEVQRLMQELQPLLKMASSAGLISATNHSLLDAEISKYIDALHIPENVSDLLKIETREARMDRLPATTIKDKVEYDRAEERVPKVAVAKDSAPVSGKKSNRQSVILDLIKRKKEIMIKDVSSVITGCSEKTIQRELLAMVKAGTLRKVGEKRWSRYSLA